MERRLCLAKANGLIAALGGLNHRAGSANLSSEVDGLDGRVSNCKHRIESEDETDKVGEVLGRSEEKAGMDECGNL